MSAKPIGDQALIDDLRGQLAAIRVGSNPGFLQIAHVAVVHHHIMYGDFFPTQDQMEADRHRRRWGRRLQRLVERPINAVMELVNRLGGDMYT